MATDCDLRTRTEVKLNDEGKERMDLIIYQPGQAPTHMDITVVNAVTKAIQTSHLGNSIDILPQARAKQAEKSKKDKYGAVIKSFGHQFIPAAFEAHGEWGPAFASWFREFIDKHHKSAFLPKPLLTAYWRSRISMALAQGVSSAIVTRAYCINQGTLLASGFASDAALLEGTIDAQTSFLHPGSFSCFRDM